MVINSGWTGIIWDDMIYRYNISSLGNYLYNLRKVGSSWCITSAHIYIYIYVYIYMYLVGLLRQIISEGFMFIYGLLGTIGGIIGIFGMIGILVGITMGIIIGIDLWEFP